jgi:uncharacterized protein involved in exopolysaccharide biosynthesis/Mrp family chromosome partitioning ATPase
MQSLVGVLRRQWRVAAIVAVCTFAVALAGGLLLPKRFVAEAYVTIPALQQETTSTPAASLEVHGDEAALVSELQVLRSNWLGIRSVEALMREGDSEIGFDDDWYSPLRRILLWGQGVVGWKAPSPSPQARLQTAAARVESRLSVEREANSRVIRIQFWSHNPKRAERVVNTLVSQYQHAQVDAKAAAMRDLREMLAAPIEDLHNNARKADESVEAFRQQAGVINSNDGSLLAKQISSLGDLLIQVRARRQADEARVQALRAGRGMDSLPEALQSGLIAALRQQQSLLTQSLIAVQAKLNDDSPQVIEARRKLAEVEGRIGDEIRRVADSIQREVVIETQREAAIQVDIDAKRLEYDRQNAALVKMRELERDAQANRVLVSAFLERDKEIRIRGIVAQPTALVLSWAIEPATPSFPKFNWLFMVCLGVAVVLGLGVATVREFLRSGLRSLNELDSTYPAAGIVPATPARLGPPEDLVVSNPSSAYAEAFRKLLTVTTVANAGTLRSILVTSSLPGEGKTASVLSLARVAAFGGRRVVVVDCDMMNPGLWRCLAEPGGAGLAEVLQGHAQLGDVIRRDRFNQIDIIPAGRLKGRLYDLLAGNDGLAEVLLELRGRYDLVLVDSPPSAVVADTRLLAGLVDATLFFVQWGKTPIELAQNEFNTLLADGRMAGIVLNRADMKELTPYGRHLTAFYPAYSGGPGRR